jgi:large subunit ribosomal protein L3
MKKAILAKKLGMSQIFAEDGKVIPVTVLEAGPCLVVHKKTVAKDGYSALQVGFEDVREMQLKKAKDKAKLRVKLKGVKDPNERESANKANKKAKSLKVGNYLSRHRLKLFREKIGADVLPKRYLRELRLDDCDQFEVGSEIKADFFVAGEFVDVSGTSKGKGFQGAIKRHGQHRGPLTHGSKYHRGLGSMGAGTTPGRVRKGKNMPGHMGAEAVTVQNLEIVRTDAEKNLILIKGAVPGVKGALVTIKSTVKM